VTPLEVARAEIRVKIVLWVQALKQACQTGGPIACSMRPAITFFIIFMIDNYSKLEKFTVISDLKIYNNK